MSSPSKRMKSSASSVPRIVSQATTRHRHGQGIDDFHPMDDPSVPIHHYPHIDELTPADVDSDPNDDDFIDPDSNLHNTLSSIASFSVRVRMPPAGSEAILHDGQLIHEYNPDFLRTYGEDSKIVSRFTGRVTSIGIPSKIYFYHKDSDYEIRFGNIEAVDINTINYNDLARYQREMFPTDHGMDYFVDCRHSIRLLTYVWKKIPYEDLRTNVLRRVEVIRLLFEEY